MLTALQRKSKSICLSNSLSGGFKHAAHDIGMSCCGMARNRRIGLSEFFAAGLYAPIQGK